MESEINSNFSDITSDIRKFIKLQKAAPKINAKVISTHSHDNQIGIEFPKINYLNKGSTISVNDSMALVLYSNGKKAYLKIESNNTLTPGDLVEIDDNLTRIILKRLEKTLDKIDANDLKESSRKILNFLLEKNKPSYNKSNFKNISSNLNESQAISIEKAVNAQDFHLIVGPPGTGKTYVIKEIIKQLSTENQKVLITAWTNIAVDNILERLDDVGEDKILRIGSKKEINPANLKFTLFEKRKSHSSWNELRGIESEISYKQKELNKLFDELSLIQNEIIPFENKKKQYITILSNIKTTIQEFKSIKENIDNNEIEESSKLQEINNEIEKLKKLSIKYTDTAQSVYDAEIFENDLPDTKKFYLLEGELKKLKGKGMVKKISSIFDKKGYKDYHEKLNITEENYQKMVEEYNNYWDLKDLCDEKLKSCYGENEGNPDEDALLYELELCQKCYSKNSLKKADIEQYLKREKDDLLLKSYQIYIESLENKLMLIKGEISQLNNDITNTLKKKSSISNIISNLRDNLDNLELDKRELISIIDEDILNRTNFVFSTVISSASYLLNNEHFDMMLMDEASQVSSYMALIPLIKCDKFILVGDDKQLQPIADEKLSEKNKQSIFNNLIEKYPDSHTFLDTQYRMNGQIANIASNLFYNNKLKTHPSIQHQKIDCDMNGDLKEIIAPNKPITVIDTTNLDSYEDGTGQGCKNTKEALIINELIHYLLSQGIKTEEIGIITPFAKQKEKIKEVLKNNVEVDTVYRFQGREKEIIIMSFCKSKIGKMGRYIKKFIEQPTQINVAITRARRKLIIVGNIKTLQESKILRELIKSIGEESIIFCSEEHLKLLKLEFSDKNIKKEKSDLSI